MTVEALWRRLVTIAAGREGARLCWPGAGPQDRAAWHEAAHILAGWWAGALATGAAVVPGGGVTTWADGERADLMRPADCESDIRQTRRLVAALLTAAGVAPSFRGARYLIRAARREAGAGLRFEYWALMRLGRELDRRGALTAVELEEIRRELRAGGGLNPRDRAAAGLLDLGAVLAEARRRWLCSFWLEAVGGVTVFSVRYNRDGVRWPLEDWSETGPGTLKGDVTVSAQRRTLLEEWGQVRSASALLYVTGDRQGWETQVHSDALDRFSHHLDCIGKVKKISLILYTRGGSPLAAWSMVNLIRQFCEEFEVVVPAKAHSAGTLICLGADTIMMTKQATLGPIDPSVNGPLNPPIPGAPPPVRAPVSVEAINGFLDFAREGAGLRDPVLLKDIFLRLSEHVHPLVLGDAYRSRTQIRMLARRLLVWQMDDEAKVNRILDFLCSESGSHDYMIYRREARDELGLKVERPDTDLYNRLKAIYDDFAEDLKLAEPYSPDVELAGDVQKPYTWRRCILESVAGGSHVFVSTGTLLARNVQQAPGIAQRVVEDRRTFEGWRHENV